MAESTRPTLGQLRKLYLLIGECCELGADPIAWRKHLAENLPLLFRCQLGMYSEYDICARPFHDLHWLKTRNIFDFGWPTPGDRKPFEEHLKGGRPEWGPHITPDLLHRPLKVFHWSGDLGRTEWQRSSYFNELVKKTHLDDGLFAHHLTGPGKLRWVFVNRALKDRPFGARERRLMALLNVELARLLGTRLAPLGGPSVTELPPRMREILVALMEGESEKAAAARLGLSQHTVHEHVRRLYRRFAVNSRGELLARCRKFWPTLAAMDEQSARLAAMPVPQCPKAENGRPTADD